MFGPSGTIGILCIGFIGGYYFARFFDLATSLTPMELGTLLTLLGIGPTALILVQGYFRLSLLDPYGIGLLVGILLNFILKNVRDNFTLKTLIPSSSTPSEAVGQPPQTPTRVSFLETVSATSSAGSLEDATAKAIERRYLLKLAEQAVKRWLKEQFPYAEILSQKVFPDFLVRKRDQRLGIEVLAAGRSRAVFNLLLRQFLWNTRKGIDAKDFEESWLILVADNIGRARELAELMSEWRPGLPVHVIIGVLGDDGTFRPVDAVGK